MTDVVCPTIPDVVCVSGAQWVDAYDPKSGPITSGRIRPPMPTAVWNSLRMAAAQNFDREVCGFITESWQIVFVTNVAKDPAKEFVMHPDQYKDAIKRIFMAKDTVIGVFHTHPSGTGSPSHNDVLGWPTKDLHWRYWIATQHDVYEWEYRNQPDTLPGEIGDFNDELPAL